MGKQSSQLKSQLSYSYWLYWTKPLLIIIHPTGWTKHTKIVARTIVSPPARTLKLKSTPQTQKFRLKIQARQRRRTTRSSPLPHQKRFEYSATRQPWVHEADPTAHWIHNPYQSPGIRGTPLLCTNSFKSQHTPQPIHDWLVTVKKYSK